MDCRNLPAKDQDRDRDREKDRHVGTQLTGAEGEQPGRVADTDNHKKGTR